MPELKIDRSLRNIIPPLTSQEYEELEKSIVFEGCREPIVVWNGLIIDGHNRYDICTKNKIPFEILQKNFASKKEALKWMISNQLGRRNLNDAQKIELALKREEIIGTNIGTGKPLSREVQAKIAEDTNTSKGNVSKVKNVLEKAPKTVKDQMRKGDISINQAEKTTKPKAPSPAPIPKPKRNSFAEQGMGIPDEVEPDIKEDHKQCPTCKGTGQIMIVKMDIREGWTCPSCGREHKINLDTLEKCKGCGEPV